MQRLDHMIGYQDSSPSNGCWLTCPIVNPNYTLFLTIGINELILKVQSPHTSYRLSLCTLALAVHCSQVNAKEHLWLISQHWFQYWLGAIKQQAITRHNADPDLSSHYQSQCWPRWSMSPHGITWPQWLQRKTPNVFARSRPTRENITCTCIWRLL